MTSYEHRETGYKLLKCGKLFDGIHDVLQPDMEILVDGTTIRAVGKNLAVPEGCKTVDLSDVTVTPGMMDAHTHIAGFRPLERNHELIYNGPAYKGMAVVFNAERALHRGFTSVRFMGSVAFDSYAALDAKRAINEGFFDAARLVVMPYVQCTPGSHGDFSQILRNNNDLCEHLYGEFPTCGSGADFFVDSVRKQVKYGADLIKLMPGGGFATPNDLPDSMYFTDAEMKAVIDTSHSLGKRATAHVYADNAISKLLEFGLDEFQHCSLASEAILEEMEKKNVPLVPTFTPFEPVVHPKEGKELPYYAVKMLKYKEALTRTRELIVKSNITLGFGADASSPTFGYHGAFEYEAMMKSGLDPFRILKAATSVNAKLLELDDRLGTIEPGKLADIAGWKRDLLTDPNALKDCAFVMKEGKIFDTEPVIDD